MLSWTEVITYLKNNLGLPSGFIEDTDSEMEAYCKAIALKEFSRYYPDSERVGVVAESTTYQHPTFTNRYYIFDPENLDIISIKQCYFSGGSDFVDGHPAFGAFSFESMQNWSLEVFKSRFFMPFSNYKKTYKFYPPNMVEVLPNSTNENFVCEYERMHPEDLRRIPASMYMDFMDLCLGHYFIKVGNMRSHFGDGRLSTPFGEIPINGSELLTRGQEIRREVVERLSSTSLPSVVIDIG